MVIIDNIVHYLEIQATPVPLEYFVSVGAFVEEIIAPIPSPIVMVLAGTLAEAQHQPFVYLLWLALLGAVGKTIASWILYYVTDKLEDIVIGKFGKFLGVSHAEVESIGKRLNGGWQDNLFVFLARAIPIIPSAPVSIACGAIKLNIKTYLTSTFFGTIVRNIMYLYLGFAGLGNYKEISQGLSGYESIGQLVLFAVIATVIGWAYLKRKKIAK